MSRRSPIHLTILTPKQTQISQMETTQSVNMVNLKRVQTYYFWFDSKNEEIWCFRELMKLPGNYVRLNTFVVPEDSSFVCVQMNPSTVQFCSSPDLPDVYHIVHK